MGCYLNVTENHWPGSANSPPPFWSSKIFDICRLFHHSLDLSEIQESFKYMRGREKILSTGLNPSYLLSFNIHCTHPSYLQYSIFTALTTALAIFESWGKAWDTIRLREVVYLLIWICSSTGPSGPVVRFISSWIHCSLKSCIIVSNLKIKQYKSNPQVRSWKQASCRFGWQS